MAFTIIWNIDADGDWGTIADWSPARAPTSSDDVDINTADLHTVTFSTGTVTVNSLTVGNDNFTVSGGALTVTTTASFANALTVSGGTLSLGGSTTVTGLFTQGSSSISGAGTLTSAGGAVFSSSNQVMTGSTATVLQGATVLQSSDSLFLDGGRVLENEGTLTESGSSHIVLGRNPFAVSLGGGTLQNDASGTINFNNTSFTDAVQINTGTTAFTNAGLVENTGTGETQIDAAFTNTGTVSVTAGQLDLHGGGSSLASAITVSSGATLEFNSTYTLNGGTMAGTGTVTLGGGTLVVASNTVLDPVFTPGGGTVSGAATLTTAGGAVFSGSNQVMTGSGTAVLQGTTALQASDGLFLDAGWTLENKGTLTESGSSHITLGRNPFATSIGGATLQNDASGTINFNNTSFTDAVQINAGTTVFTNAGLVENTGTGETQIDTTFTNTGTVSVTAGQLDLHGGGSSLANTITVASGATLDFDSTFTLNGGTMAGTGTVILGGGTLVVASNTVLDPMFAPGSGTVSGSGTLTTAGGAVFAATNQLMTGSSTTVLQGTTALQSSDNLFLDAGRVLENKGTLTETGSSHITLGRNPFATSVGGSTLQNDASGTINFNNTSFTDAVQVNLGTNAFTNAGLVENTGAGESQIDAAFTNTGTVSVTAGQLDFHGGGSSLANAITVASGATLLLNSTFTLNGGTMAGTGTLALGGGTLVLASNTILDPVFSPGTGTVSGAGALTTAGGAVFNGSNQLMIGGSTTVLQGATALQASDSLFLDVGRVLENEGTLTESGSSHIYLGRNPFAASIGGGTLQNDASGTINFNNTSFTDAVQVNLGTNAFTNAGLVENTGIGESQIDAAFTNTGTVSVTAGQLDFHGGGSSLASAITVSSGATLDFNSTFTLNGGTMAGAGTVILGGGTLVVASNTTMDPVFTPGTGTVSGAGTLTLAGGAVFNGANQLMTGSSTTVLQGATALQASDNLGLDAGRVLENEGTLTESASSHILLGRNLFGSSVGGGTLQNDASGTINFNNTSFTDAVEVNTGATAFINAGLVENTGVGQTQIDAAFTNNGTVSVIAGELDIIAAMTGTGSVTVASSTTFVLNAASTTTANSVNIASGAGLAKLTGGSAGDTFQFGGNLTAADIINGNGGNDSLVLNGDYSAGFVFGATTLTNVETISLMAGHNYNLTTNNANLAAGLTMTVDGSALGASDVLIFNGSAEADGNFVIKGGAGNDALTSGTGIDTINGGGGNDTINMGSFLTAADQIDGGTGNDTVTLNGDYSAGLTLGATTLVNVETMSVAAGHSFTLTTNDANVAAGQTLTIDASTFGASDVLTFNGAAETSGNFVVDGGAANDVMTGGAGNDAFNLGTGGNDTATGGVGNDTFNMGAALTSADTLDGGTGSDTVTLNGDYSAGLTLGATTLANIETISFAAGHNYNLTTNDATVAAGQTLTVDGSALGAGDVLTFNGAAETNGSFVINGGAGSDVLTAATGNDTFNLGTGGNDTAKGGGGNDTFNMGAALTAADQIDGGTGADTVVLNGDYSAGVTLGAGTMVNVENLTLTAGHSYNLTTNNANVAAGKTLTVNGSTLGAGDTLTFNGAAETDGTFVFNSGAGNDVLTGGSGADIFNLTTGGNDTATGGGGNDTFNLGAALTSADKINGSAGTDTVVLSGNYSAGVVLGAATIANIETVSFTAGHNYNLTSNDGNVAAGQTLTVDGSTLGASDVLIFNGAAESDGTFVFNGGAGNDVLTGGAGSDIFNLATGGNDTANGGGGNDTFNLGAAFTSADAIDGGAGADTVILNGDYSAGVTLGAATLANVETLSLTAGHSYNLASNNGNVAAGQTLTIDGSALGASDGLTFNGAAETDGSFVINGGAGNDALTGGGGNDGFNLATGGNDSAKGGNGNDTFNLGAALTSADRIDGGTGTDTVALNGNYSAAHVLSAGTIVNVETISLAAGNSYNLTTNDGNVAAGQTLTIDGSALGASDALTFNGAAELDGKFVINGGAGNDVLTGGSGNDVFNLTTGGNDTAIGGGGSDTFSLGAALTATDQIDGGLGNDIVALSGDYSTGLVLGAATLANIEAISLAAGHSYNLTTNDANVAAGQTLTVNGSALGASDVLTFNGAAELDGNFVINGGAGNDVLTGGSGNDVFNLATGGNDTAKGGNGNDTFNLGASLVATDRITGGAGTDTVVLNGDYSAGFVFGAATMVTVENLSLTAGHSYNLTTNNAIVAAGQTLTVDGSTLGAGDAFAFNGAAETDGSFIINGGAGTDVLSGGAGNDTFNMGAALTAADQINGGVGNDTVTLNGDYSAGLTLGATTLTNVETVTLAAGHSYSLTTNNSNVAAGQTLTVDGSALGAGDVFTFNGAAETDGSFVINGGAGNDILTGSAGNDVFNLAPGGNDIVKGGGGNDTFNLGASLTASDKIDGGAGSDTVVLNGDYSAKLSFGATTLVNVENLSLTAGHSYNLVTKDANVAAGQTLTVDGSTLGASDVLTFNGALETDGNFVITGGAGNDALTGGSGADIFNLATGGNDTVKGADGNDTINFGASFTTADHIDGGTGSDTVVLNGDYSAKVAFGAATLVNVENLSLTAGHSYNLATNDANVAAGQTLTIDGSALGASDALTFNGSAELDGNFVINGGTGSDTLTGGAGGDIFNLATGGNDTVKGGGGNDTINLSASFTAADHIDGGTGVDVVVLNGDYSAKVTFGAATLANVETLSLVAGHSYNLVTNDANVAAGQTLTIDGSTLGASDVLTFKGSAETDGSFIINGGAGNDVLTGGAGADVLTGGGGADTLTGGLGNNTYVYNAASDSTGLGFDTVSGFDALADHFQVFSAVGAIDSTVSGGALDAGAFDADLASALSGHLLANDAILYKPTTGSFAGHTFLVIDQNGAAGYQSGNDIVIDLTSAHHLTSLTTADFLT